MCGCVVSECVYGCCWWVGRFEVEEFWWVWLFGGVGGKVEGKWRVGWEGSLKWRGVEWGGWS